jgi:hypothetical protein
MKINSDIREVSIVIYFKVLIGKWIMGVKKTTTNLSKDN